jgi:hypothetical protein
LREVQKKRAGLFLEAAYQAGGGIRGHIYHIPFGLKQSF